MGQLEMEASAMVQVATMVPLGHQAEQSAFGFVAMALVLTLTELERTTLKLQPSLVIHEQ
jgi:hypothetical protein